MLSFLLPLDAKADSLDLALGSQSLERINEFIELTPEDEISISTVQIGQNSVLWPTEGKVEFVDYSMRYK